MPTNPVTVHPSRRVSVATGKPHVMERWRIIDSTQGPHVIDAAHGGLDVDGVLVPLTTLTGAAIHTCTNHHVPILHCVWTGVPHTITYPWASPNTRVNARRRAQVTPRKTKPSGDAITVVK